MSKDYVDPLDLLALAAAGLLEPSELDAAYAARAGEPELAAALERGWEALGDPPPAPALPAQGWARLRAALDEHADERGDEQEDAPAIAIALACVYCHDRLSLKGARYCASCLAPHHGECFAAHGHCAAPGCSEVHTVRAQLEEPAPTASPRRWRPGPAVLGAALLGVGVAALAPRLLTPQATRRRAPEATRSPEGGAGMRVYVERNFAKEPEQDESSVASAFRHELERGHRAEAERRLEQALEHYTEAIDLEPSSAEAFAARGRVRLSLDDRGRAQWDLEKALEHAEPRSRLAQRVRCTLAALSIEDLDYEQAQRLLPDEDLLEGELRGNLLDDELRAILDEVRELSLELWLSWGDPLEAQLGDAERAAFLEATRRVHDVTRQEAQVDGEFREARWRAALCFALRAGLYDDAKALARLCLNDGWADGTRAFANAALGVAATFAPQAKDEANALALSCFEVASRLAPDDSFALAAQGLAEPNRPAQAWRVELAVRARNLAISGDGAASRAYRAGLRWAEAAGAGRERASYQRARRAFVRAEQLHPLHAPALLARGRLYAAWSQRGLAQAAVSRALELDPRSVSGHVVQGELQLRFAGAGPADLGLARKTFEHAVSLAGSPETGGDAVEAYFGRAQVALAEAEQLAPEEPARAARIAQAREDLTLALDATPDRYPAGRPQDVRFALRLLEALRDLCRDHGSPEQARDFATRLEETRAAARAAAEKLRAQARALRDALRNREALEVLGVAQALAPEEGAVYFERGLCYLKVGSFVPGIVDLSRALELNPRLADEVYAKVYQITYVVDLHRVITELDKIVADHPDEAHVIFLRGFFFVARVEFKEYTEGDLLRGIEDFDRCLALNPRHVTARLYRGFLEFKRANPAYGKTPEEVQAAYRKALADYEHALELDPGSVLSHYLQALLWAQRLRDAGAAEAQRGAFRTRALQHFQRALELGFRAFDRVKNEAAFDALRDDEGFLRLLGQAR